MANKSDGAPRFNQDLVHAACKGGEPKAIEELSHAIRAALKARTPGGVFRDGDIADSEAANFAYRMLRACERRAVAPPSALVDLFQVLLLQDRPPHRRTRRYVQREEARRYIEKNPKAGVREVARAVGVNASTVSRWGLLR